MGYLLAVALVLSVLSRWSCAQAPGDEDPICTEILPRFGVNILNYPPEVKPLMDSRHYQHLLPQNTHAVWQTVDNDNNNTGSIITSVSTVVVTLYWRNRFGLLQPAFIDCSQWKKCETAVKLVEWEAEKEAIQSHSKIFAIFTESQTINLAISKIKGVVTNCDKCKNYTYRNDDPCQNTVVLVQEIKHIAYTKIILSFAVGPG